MKFIYFLVLIAVVSYSEGAIETLIANKERVCLTLNAVFTTHFVNYVKNTTGFWTNEDNEEILITAGQQIEAGTKWTGCISKPPSVNYENHVNGSIKFERLNESDGRELEINLYKEIFSVYGKDDGTLRYSNIRWNGLQDLYEVEPHQWHIIINEKVFADSITTTAPTTTQQAMFTRVKRDVPCGSPIPGICRDVNQDCQSQCKWNQSCQKGVCESDGTCRCYNGQGP